MTRTFSFLVLATLILATFSGCKQLQQVKAFAKCEFKMQSIQNVKLANVNTEGKNELKDFSVIEISQIARSYVSGKLPLTMTVNVKVKNPNDQTAALNKVDWIALLDGVEIGRNVIDKRIEVAPNGGEASLPIQLRTDLNEVFSDRSKESSMNLALNIFGKGDEPSKLTLRIKPSLNVAGTVVQYPGYINVTKEFSSNNVD